MTSQPVQGHLSLQHELLQLSVYWSAGCLAEYSFKAVVILTETVNHNKQTNNKMIIVFFSEKILYIRAKKETKVGLLSSFTSEIEIQAQPNYKNHPIDPRLGNAIQVHIHSWDFPTTIASHVTVRESRFGSDHVAKTFLASPFKMMQGPPFLSTPGSK